MIKTATQLKAKIRNVSGGDNKTAMTMIRVYFMERFLERVSNSSYKNRFVLKGGTCGVSALQHLAAVVVEGLQLQFIGDGLDRKSVV